MRIYLSIPLCLLQMTSFVLLMPCLFFICDSKPQSSSTYSTELSSSSDECSGSVLNLNADEATIIKSHRNFGHLGYPPNYRCRWVIFPTNCDLSVSCDTNFEKQDYSRHSSTDCLKQDHLRLIGFKGRYNSTYCSKVGPSINLSGPDPLEIIFISSKTERVSNKVYGKNIGSICQIRCKKPSDREVMTMKTITPKSRKPKRQIHQNCNCGVVPSPARGRIVCPHGENCTTVSQLDNPWHVGIVIKGKKKPWCGGTLFTGRHVLTAAHCLHGRRAQYISVVLGDWDWSTRKESKELRFSVKSIIRHPHYRKRAAFDNDMAILVLDNSIDFNTYHHIRPICLPDEAASMQPTPGTKGSVTGWGYRHASGRPGGQSHVLQTVNVFVKKQSYCKKSYGIDEFKSDTMFCASRRGADSCFGDSGGPMIVQGNRGAVLVGIISWGKSCANVRWPGVYTNLAHSLSWIKENSKEGNLCPKKNT